MDDHPVFAEALATVLSRHPDLVVVGSAGNPAAAVRMVRSLQPDLCILDVSLGDADGVLLAPVLRQEVPDLVVVMLTGVDAVDRIVDAVRSGVTSWVLKEASTGVLLGALRAAVRGEGYLPPTLLAPVLWELVESSGAPAGPLRTLTPREREILQCLVDGLDRTAIAARLYVSPHTVRTHTQNLLAKLDAHSALEAVAVALSNGVRPSVDADGTAH